MKMVSMIAGLMFSASAIAAPAYNTLVGNSKYLFDASSINFKHSNGDALEAFFVRPISLDGYAQVCVAGDRLFAGVVTACTKKEQTSSRLNDKCVATAPSALSVALGVNTKPICIQTTGSDDRCVAWGTKNFLISSTVTVKVYNKMLVDEDRQTNSQRGLVGTYKVALPACGDTVTPAN